MNKVMLTTYPGAFMCYGGGEREIHLLNEAINSSEIVSDIYGPLSRPITNYKSIIHFSMVAGSEYVIMPAVENGLRLILWPNIWFVTEPSSIELIRLTVFLNYFHAVVFRSSAEEEHFKKYFSLDGKDVIRVSSLISPKFNRHNITDIFRDSYGLTNYAIWPGVIEPQKNQLTAIKAFNELDIDLVISGQIRNKAYFEECKRLAKSNIKFIPAMPFGSDLHVSALVNSMVVVELPLDFPGTSAIEAAALGCPLLLSRSEWTEELLGKHCLQVNPNDEIEIRSAISQLPTRAPVNKIEYLDMKDAVRNLTSYISTI